MDLESELDALFADLEQQEPGVVSQTILTPPKPGPHASEKGSKAEGSAVESTTAALGEAPDEGLGPTVETADVEATVEGADSAAYDDRGGAIDQFIDQQVAQHRPRPQQDQARASAGVGRDDQVESADAESAVTGALETLDELDEAAAEIDAAVLEGLAGLEDDAALPSSPPEFPEFVESPEFVEFLGVTEPVASPTNTGMTAGGPNVGGDLQDLTEAAPSFPSLQPTEPTQSESASSSQTGIMSDDDLALQLESLFGSAADVSPSAEPASVRAAAVSAPPAPPAPPDAPDAPGAADVPHAVPAVAANAATIGRSPGHESLDQIDELLAEEADHKVEGDFETPKDVQAAAVVKTPGPEPANAQETVEETPAPSTILYSDDTKLGSSQAPKQQSFTSEAPRLQTGATARDVEQELSQQPELAASGSTVAAAEEDAKKRLRRLDLTLLWAVLDPVLRRICAVLSKPLAGLSPQTRDTIGYFALIHLFLGSVLIFGKLMGII